MNITLYEIMYCQMGQMAKEIRMPFQRLPQVSLSNKTYVSISDVLLCALGLTFETKTFFAIHLIVSGGVLFPMFIPYLFKGFLKPICFYYSLFFLSCTFQFLFSQFPSVGNLTLLSGICNFLFFMNIQT